MSAGLRGRRILVTRPRASAGAWVRRIEARGGHPVVLPCVEVQDLTDEETRARVNDAIAHAAWLAVTSARGARSAARLLGGSLTNTPRVAAVGQETARAVSALGGNVALVATPSTGAALGQALAARWVLATSAGEGVVVIGACGGRSDVEDALRAYEVPVVRVNVYRSGPMAPTESKVPLEAASIDVILLASPSAAQGLCHVAKRSGEEHIVTIGPTTTAAARALGLPVMGEANRPTLDAMLEVIP